MDLDKVKKSWQEVKPSSSIGKEKIEQMLNNTARGAFNKLLTYERCVIYIWPILILLSYFIKEKSIAIFFFTSTLVGICWQIYKYNFLKKTDIVSMNLLEISERISKYRIYVYREFIIAFVWSILFTIYFSYIVIHDNYAHSLDRNPNSEVITIIIFSIWTIVIVPFLTWIIYKKFFVKNIKKVEQSLAEAEEYIKDNRN